MKKILNFIIFILFITTNVYATQDVKNLAKDFNLRSDMSVLIKDVDKNEIIYKKNENKKLNPASTLKVLTFGASYITLGENYEFKTSLYKNNDDYYLKLGADPKLTQKDLNNLFKKANIKKINNLYIDDTIIDKKPYPDSWLDEDKYPTSRMITPYIVDDNVSKFSIKRSSLSHQVDILQEDDYKVAIFNNLILTDEKIQDVKIERLHGENAPILTFSGKVYKDETINLPVLNPEINFTIKLLKAIDKNNIEFKNMPEKKATLKNLKEIAYVSHNIKDISSEILHNSNNFVSEITFLVAGAKYINYSHSATYDDAIKMFENVFKDSLEIKDGSGVSRENKITTSFYLNTLEKIFKETNIKTLMTKANQGTMKDRLTFLEDNLISKTGTLRNYSSICGTLKTKKNNNLIFVLIEQDQKIRKALLKNYEDMLIGLLYQKY